VKKNKKKAVPNQQDQLFEDSGENLDALPILRDLIEGFMPDLLDGSAHSDMVLQHIFAFLFGPQAAESSSHLEKLVHPDFFTALSGLKIILKKNSPQAAQLQFELHKQRFGDWLKKMI
jgi:hypothetical protein